jgi:predicted ester cyclase
MRLGRVSVLANLEGVMAAATIQDLRARREAVVKAHFQAETVDHDATAAIVDGAAAVEEFLTQLFNAFPDLWLRQRALYHADNAVTVECRFGGTYGGVWAGVAPTGRSVDVESALIFPFEGTNLICEKVYFDNATILRQLGALA